MWLAIDALNLRRDGRPKSVHEADDHRALADRGGAALDGSGTDVADGEDARDGRVEQPGSARLRAGENKAALVAGDSIAEPAGTRLRAEEHERELHRQTRAVPERDAVEAAAVAVQLRDLGAIANLDAVAVEISDEIARHRLVQVPATVQQRDQRAIPRKPDRRLPCGVPAADDGHVLGTALPRLGRTGGVEDARTLELGKPGQV